MKRPFAVTGFTMLAVSLLFGKKNFKVTLIALAAMAVAFCFLLLFKKARKDKTALVAIAAAFVYGASFLCGSYQYYKTIPYIDTVAEISGTVCETPEFTDFAAIYVIKADRIGEKRTNCKIKYISDTDMGFKDGDKVKGKIKLVLPDEKLRMIENNLAERIFFFSFLEDGDTIAKTGKINYFYRFVGSAKNYFINTTLTYLPGENGAIADAMVIGDRSDVSDYTRCMFNYAGTAHLLVVSGLHVTMWSLGIMRLMGKSRRLRKIMIPVGFIGLFFYSAITGFSVSVLRAGAMVGGVLLGRMFYRASDSLNSIGLALTFILLFNPFASFSIGLWLSVLSTSGMLLFSGKAYSFIINSAPFRPIRHHYIVRKIAEVLSVSLPTAAFTLPVFVKEFGMLPIASFLSNFLMVGASLLLMVITVTGMLAHILHLRFIANGAYFVAGLIAEFLKYAAEKIGLADWSTLSVSHKCFKYFFVVAALILLIAAVLKRYGKNIMKPAALSVLVLFIATSFYSAYDIYNTPAVDIIEAKGNIEILITSGDRNALIGCDGKFIYYDLKEALNSRNKKRIDTMAVLDFKEDTVMRMLETRENFPVENTVFATDAPDILAGDSPKNVKSLTVDGKFKVDLSHPDSFVTVSYGNCDILVVFRGAYKFPFENTEKYDIITVYESDCERIGEILENDKSKIYKIKERDIVNIRF